jgi:hypothetical protein
MIERKSAAPPFDALASADFLVPDRDLAVAAVQQALGFVTPKPHWSWGGPGQGFEVTFCRPTPSLWQSPTLVELIAAAALDPRRPVTEVVPNVAGLSALQGDRPLKTHGAPVAGTNVDELIERVRSQGLRHWVQPSSDAYPFRRLWMGIAADDLADYRAGGDGGLMLEVVDTRTLGLPESLVEGSTPEPEAPPVGMVRTSTRGFLVDDLDRSLDELSTTFSWEPELGPERAENGSRRAVLGFSVAQSARIELLQPARASEEGTFLERFGPGVWAIRIAVGDLDAKAEDLRARGTPYQQVDTGFDQPATRLRVDAAATPNCLFEFESLPTA